MNNLESLAEALAKCSKCGDCQAVCPIYRETKKEGSVARGRNALLRFAMEEEIPFNGDFKETLYECLLCGRCAENCSAGVPTPDILLAARENLAQKDLPWGQKLIFHHLIPFPKRLMLTNRLLKIYQNTGLRYLLKKSGLIGVLGPLAKSEDVIPGIPPTFRDAQARLKENPLQPTCRVGYFLGCGTNLLKPAQGIAAVNTLRQMGCRVEIPEVFCCGLPAVTYGQGEAARELARRNMDLLQKGNYDYIVSDCASCTSMVQDYQKLFPPQDPYAATAKQMAAKIVDYAQLLLKLDPWKSLSGDGQKVTYHVPCHLARDLKAGEEPKEVLKKITGIKYVELPEADVCCGAGGSYFVTHPELAESILSRKMEQIRTTGANQVVTSCPVCLMQLEHGARIFHVPVKARHLAEIVQEAWRLY
ncbi:(Fe-S)-binding protein [Candidatus Formimonas warabiya]|uniref:Glycolate oxidase iron-sulfur subunit n=1 Tax=Formimonas warabiya TaxID=1761012 RepID=A0A3G1KV59_FORW1|nr:(Fe-S)-binding protein [Candidatus Formimonas warabiya]ATW26290.1 hypothetical protein DCMF_17345 [Candidatus Formimonas warabiya]